jgi:threonine aldolase
VKLADYAANFDSVWVDFSKGLGCPVGAVLAGNKDFIDRAWRYKHLFGGAMRQSGILAGGCIYALDHHVERLRDDHENAKLLAKGLAQIDGIELITPQPETNIVFFRSTNPRVKSADFLQATLKEGVRFSGLATGLRAVTHLDISKSDVEQAIQVVRKIFS